MKKNFYRAISVLVLFGACAGAHAELVCLDTEPGAKTALRTGCVVDRAAKATRPVAQRPQPGQAIKAGQVRLPAAQVSATPTMQWEIKASDLSIYGALKRWSDQNGWQLSWEVATDYQASITGSFPGNFRGAIDEVLDAYRTAEIAPLGCFYDNKVVRVVRRVGDGRECEQRVH